MTNFAQQAEQARDLRNQIQGLESSATRPTEMSFEIISPGRVYISLWNTETGEEISIPQYMVPTALTRRQNGRYLFTANRDMAPPVNLGSISCFLAANSEERQSGLLKDAGLDMLPACPAEHLRTEYAKERHEAGKHINSSASFRHFKERREREAAREAQQRQTDAILALAAKDSRPPEPVAAQPVAQPAVDDLAAKDSVGPKEK